MQLLEQTRLAVSLFIVIFGFIVDEFFTRLKLFSHLIFEGNPHQTLDNRMDDSKPEKVEASNISQMFDPPFSFNDDVLAHFVLIKPDDS